MCFDIDSAPPVPAIAGASVSHELLKLRAADGNELAAFLATPDVPGRTGIVLLPDVRAAVEHLRGLGAGSIFTVGFCFGGRASWVAAASGHGLSLLVVLCGPP